MVQGYIWAVKHRMVQRCSIKKILDFHCDEQRPCAESVGVYDTSFKAVYKR